MATKTPAKKAAPAKKTAPVKQPAVKAAPAKQPAKEAPAKEAAPVKKAAAKTDAPATVKKTAEEISKMSVYFDLYGGLLSAKQQEVYRLYYEDNLSLSEIAETFKISRQGIHESLKKAEIALKEFEDKLGLVKKDQDFNDVIKSVEDISAKILQDEAIASLKDKKDADRIRRSLKKLISVVKTIESDRIRGMHGV
jgi:predicted DNA-binding protein YlxM (UPF0122 family)